MDTNILLMISAYANSNESTSFPINCQLDSSECFLQLYWTFSSKFE